MIVQRFTYLAAALLATVMLLGAGADAAAAAKPGPASAGRTDMPLVQGWRFAFGDEHTEKSDASGWQVVDLPHTWNRIGGHPAKAADANDKRGKGWYRLSFNGGAAAARSGEYRAPRLAGGEHAFDASVALGVLGAALVAALCLGLGLALRLPATPVASKPDRLSPP